jgi:WD40 repeat protein
MPEASGVSPFETLVRAVRAERTTLRRHPADFASIVGNRLVVEGLSWRVIDGIFKSDARERPWLREIDVIRAPHGPRSIGDPSEVTACAATWNRLVAGTADGTLLKWDDSLEPKLGPAGEIAPRQLDDLTPEVAARHTARITQLAFVGGHELLLTADSVGHLRMWSSGSYAHSGSFDGHTSAITSVAFDSRGQMVAAGALDGTVRVWARNRSVPTATLIGHTAAVRGISFCPDGQHLVSCSDDGTLRVWETSSGHCLATLRGHREGVIAGAFVRERAGLGEHPILSASRDGLVKLWTREGRMVATLGGHDGPINDMRMLRGRDTGSPAAVTCSDDGTVRTWSVEKQREERVLRGHTAPVLQAAEFGEDAARVLSVGADGRCRLWELESGRFLREFRIDGGGRAQLAVSSIGQLAGCVTDAGRLARIELTGDVTTEIGPTHLAFNTSAERMLVGSGRIMRLVSLSEHEAAVSDFPAGEAEPLAAVFSTDRSFAAVHANGVIHMWSNSGMSGETLTAQVVPTAAATDAHGLLAAIGGADGAAVVIWFVERQPAVRATLSGHGVRINACACANATVERVLLAGADGRLRLWNWKTGNVVDFVAHSLPVTACDLSFDASLLLSGSVDGTLRTWNAGGGRIRDIVAHADAITGCRIGPTPNRALTCSRDRTVKLWDLESGNCLETYYADAPLVSMTEARSRPVVAVAGASGQVTILDITDASWAGTRPAA